MTSGAKGARPHGNHRLERRARERISNKLWCQWLGLHLTIQPFSRSNAIVSSIADP
jgi:hypothetical protein